MNARLTARDRLARLLSIIPWVAEHPDGAAIDDIVERFAYPRAQLLDDLQEVVFFVGVHPFTPDSLIEVEVGDDRVQIRYAEWFSRPLRLSPEEGARLLTAGRSVLPLTEGETDVESDDADDRPSPLLRALTKLGTTLGEGASQAVDVRLGRAAGDTMGFIRDALAAGRQLDLQYYSYGRDELTERRVDPDRLFSDQGNWYLSGWCHRAEGERVFRVDRIRAIRSTDTPAERRELATESSFSPSGDDPRVTIRLGPSAQWVVEQYPVESTEADGEDLIVTMAVSAQAWLERLMLRLGPDARIVSADAPLPVDLTSVAAARVLARYDR
ncbi:MAG: WYL domain-containing protein [Actinomycetota bacterium]